MLSAGRALGAAARAPRARSARGFGTRKGTTTILSRRSSAAAGPMHPQHAADLSGFASGRAGASVAALRPLALPSAAVVAVAAAGLHYQRTFNNQSLIEEDPTAPPPPLALSAAATAEQLEARGAVRRVAEALARWLQAVYRQARILLRLAEITLVASPCLVTYPLAARLQHKYPDLYEAWWSWFLASVEYLGPACIKFMQWASSRRDLFDASICDRLAGVQSHVAPHPEHATDRALQAAFGADWEAAVLELERTVLGSGCIAQVYKGRLRDGSGREVAVKVVHPGTRGKVEADLALFAGLAAGLERLIPSAKYWSIGDALREFEGLMCMQLDMTTEAANLRRLRQNFAGHPNVAFPEPLLVHPDVLVEEFIHGEPISSYIHMDDKDAPIRRQLAASSVSAFLTMLIHHNYTHADLHPGNVLVQPPTANSHGKPVLTFLDAGIVTELNAASRRAFVQIFWHACRGDGESLARTVLMTAPEEACDDPEAFVQALASIVDRFNEGAYSKKAPLLASQAQAAAAAAGAKGPVTGAGKVDRLQQQGEETEPAAAVGAVFELCREHKVKLDGALSTVVISTFILEGLARSLDPDLKLFAAALPLLVTALPLAV